MKILLVLLAGVAAGALLGILFAPDMGWNTRKRIFKKGEDYADALRERFAAFLYSFSGRNDDTDEEVINFPEQSKVKTAETENDIHNITKGNSY